MKFASYSVSVSTGVWIDCAGFSLYSVGRQLFYAEIWVVGFLPAPGHVLDKVRQVSIEILPR